MVRNAPVTRARRRAALDGEDLVAADRRIMNDPRDYKLDLSTNAKSQAPPQGEIRGSRPYISVRFDCCGTYRRIYRSADGSRYEGHCPKCAKPVRFTVGPGGTDARFSVVE